ncbi:hypothetical protein OsJ_35692 [Oryza sativa Japonica Group]|uniref:Uncharacterized protein n=1 Tax=Oryza sativa subsp. japonica TaxID=39947 RepID=B9GCJ7_ORYSJ|nr:hypothetical protein OsJ_35692 [Oryza sativa Japonica Group]
MQCSDGDEMEVWLLAMMVDSTGENLFLDVGMVMVTFLEVQCWCGILGVVSIGLASMDRLWQDLGD